MKRIVVIILIAICSLLLFLNCSLSDSVITPDQITGKWYGLRESFEYDRTTISEQGMFLDIYEDGTACFMIPADHYEITSNWVINGNQLIFNPSGEKILMTIGNNKIIMEFQSKYTEQKEIIFMRAETVKVYDSQDYHYSVQEDGSIVLLEYYGDKWVDEYGFPKDEVFQIPRFLSGMPVTKIGDKVYRNMKFKHVSFPDTITEIGEYAFESCDELIELDLPNGLETIGGYAFYHCGKLEDVKFPDTLLNIELMAFGVTHLKTICFPPNLKTVIFPGFTIDAQQFYTQEFIVKDSNKYSIVNNCLIDNINRRVLICLFPIEKEEFTQVMKLVETINDYAFLGMITFDELDIPEGIKNIGAYSFAGNDNTVLRLPGTLKALSGASFGLCFKLKDISIDSSDFIIKEAQLMYPEGARSVNPFEDCPNISSIVLTNGSDHYEISDNAIVPKQ